jgi:hypothetical protein
LAEWCTTDDSYAVGVWFRIQFPAVAEVREKADVLEVRGKMVAVVAIIVGACGIVVQEEVVSEGRYLSASGGDGVGRIVVQHHPAAKTREDEPVGELVL